MRLITLLLLLLPGSVFGQYKLGKQDLEYKKLSTPAEMNAFTYENLRLYPILARENFKKTFANINRFTTLKKALQDKKVIITEKGAGGDVNTLVVQNISQDTILINAGEVIKGGKQDRVVNTDMVLYPKSGKKDLPVFCVEQGRWSSRNDAYGRQDFKGYHSFSSVGLRKVVTKEKNQSKVWEKVSEINKENKTETATSTYTALEQSKTFKDKYAKYTQFFKNKLLQEKDIVGVIVVTGDKVVGTDIFANNDLFKSSFENLLQSYITEAIVQGRPVTIHPSKVDQYITELLDEKKQDQVLKAKGSKFEERGRKLKISSFD